MTLAEQWDISIKVVGLFVAGVGAIVGAARYFAEQRRSRESAREQQEKDRDLRRLELAWRKTQFIFELAQNFESDDRYRSALQMILVGAQLPASSSLSKILTPTEPERLSPQEKEARYCIDRYLDFFDRLHWFTMVIRSLSLEDISCFEWYVTKVRDTPALKAYAESEGYDDVLALAGALEGLSPQGATPHVGSRTQRA